MGVLTGCKPRKEVLKGDLDDAIFAADFGDLTAGNAPAVYGDAKTFFQNTHPAKQLCKVVQVVFQRLANAKEPGAMLRLSTGFGGGKTHTLMALWHLAQHIDEPALGTELLPAAGRPKSVKVVAFDASKAGVPVFARHGKREVKSLWGEVAWGLGGDKTVAALGVADDPERQPDEAIIEGWFPKGPVLILLDELVVYMATLSERGQGNLLAFMNKLVSVVARRPQSVLVVTDPGAQHAYAQHSARLAQNLAPVALSLEDVLGRKASDFDPIGDEAARVIVRRLFESVDPSAAQVASAAYHSLYERVAREASGTIPGAAVGAEYAKRIVECYPFHPRLLDTAQDRLGALEEFNKSRGTLRLFARILRTVWESGEDLELITAGDLDWSSPRIQADLLQRLNRDSFKAAVSADIEKHARELDGGSLRGIHQRAASALLIESLPLHSNSGLDPADLTLAVLRPDEAGHEPGEALDRLAGVCWHTYPMPGGRGWQFRYEPNVIKQVEERMVRIPLEDARSRVYAEAQSYFSGPTFKLVPWPSSARQVPESAELQLVLCEDEAIAKAVSEYADDTDPKAPIPRRFRNAIVAVTASATALARAVDNAQRLLAAEDIEREHRTGGDASRLVRDQLQRLKPDFTKRFRLQTYRAFDRVVLAGGTVYSVDEQYQVPDDQVLQKPQGQVGLKKFLDGKSLLYQPGDALDPVKFVKDILPGATPLPDRPDVYAARAVHERFLGAPGLRLVPDPGVVRQTILKSVGDRRIVVRLGDGRAYDAKGCVEGPDGSRRRVDTKITSLPLDETTYVTVADSEWGRAWVKEDSEPYKVGPKPPEPPPPARVTATTWEKVSEYAAARPLLELRLRAATPAAAASLSGLAQPLGADTLSFSIAASGMVKDGGTMSFAANEVKPTHPTRPLVIAQTVYNTLAEGATYEAELTLEFTGGRNGLVAQLEDVAQNAPDGVAPRATFDKPSQG